MASRRTRWTAVLASSVLITGLVTAPTLAASAEPISAVTTIEKAATSDEVELGETFSYEITVGCSSITESGCFDASVTDVVPDEFEIVDVQVSGASYDDPVTIDGQTVSVSFNGDDIVGLPASSTATVSISVRVRDDLPYAANGVPVVNEASITASNAEPKRASVTVTPKIPLKLATEAGKTLTPASALAVEGTPVTAVLTGTIDGNAPVETLTLQDPVDPGAVPNPFDYLGFVRFGEITPPAGANHPTGTIYEVYVDGAWVAASGGSLPSGVDPGEVKGTRVTFTGTIIPADSPATVELDLAHTALAAAQPDGYRVVDTVRSGVTLGTASATDDASAPHTLRADIVTVSAGKTFAPDIVVPGESSKVTLTGANTSPASIDSLTISEPKTGALDPAIIFAGFTGAVTYPEGATAATITLRPVDETFHVADGEMPVLPAGVEPNDVTGFDITFTGSIQRNSPAGVVFDVTADPTLPIATLPLQVFNVSLVTGERGPTGTTATADDVLYVYKDQLEVWIDKQVRPSDILAVPGESVTVSLTGGSADRPAPPDETDGSTVDANRIVLQDPETVPAGTGEWWDVFDLTSIALTPIPVGADLTIEYYDTSDATWKTLSGPHSGPALHSEQVAADVQEVAGGVRFVYDYTGPFDGFPPGTSFAPNFTSELRATSRIDTSKPAFDAAAGGTLQNCATSEGTIDATDGGSDATAVEPACFEVELIPVDPGRDADLIDKKFLTSSSSGNKTVISRSGDTIPARMHWSTGGYSFDRVEITDIAAPEATAIGESVFDAFNLRQVKPITLALDPYLRFDQVTDVLLYNGTSWSKATNDPCPGACTGTFPGVSLTDAEQLSTIGVRLVFVESPDRGAVLEQLAQTDPTAALAAPQVGTGVARSIAHDRALDLVFQIRDERRDTANPGPVLGQFPYNLPENGVVRNTVNASGFVDGDLARTDDAHSDVIIIDVPLTTETSKAWIGGPIAVPAPGTDPEAYPASRVRITTRNTTPAKVDQLVITDPAGTTGVTPFDVFNLYRIYSITEPDGADPALTEVTLSYESTPDQTFSKTAALALTRSQLLDVVGVSIAFHGRIDPADPAVVQLDLQLRPTVRSTGAQVELPHAPVRNEATGEISDLDGDYGRYAIDQADATIDLETPTFGVETTKTIVPAEQKVGDDTRIDMLLTAQPTGATWASEMTIVDHDATFWNAMDFVGISPSFTLDPPITSVDVQIVTGAGFVGEPGGSLTTTGYDDWTTVVTAGTAAQVKAWSAGLTHTEREAIQAIRFVFSLAAYIEGENPTLLQPRQEVPVQVERRATLRSGAPVPSTNVVNLPAPGEERAGIFTNTVTSSARSIPIDSTGKRLSATDDDTETYAYLALDTSVAVSKLPAGVQQPGKVIPFTMTFTNTGETDIHNPVFTDYLPMDAEGSQLILDPDRDPSVSPYTFSLTGPNPTTEFEPGRLWQPLPTTPTGVTVDEQTDRIVFTMPEGTALGKGQSYTITVPMMFRPGVIAGTEVTNKASITATDRMQSFTGCVVDETEPGEPVMECFADTTVTLKSHPALSSRKYVRAEDPAHAPISKPTGRTCVGPDAAGFYRAPCVPVSMPGTDVTWRFVLTNSGTLPMDKIVAIDHLPTPGDQGIIVKLPRGSKWKGIFDAFDSIELIAPGSPTLTALYSTSDTPCTADLNPLSTGCAPEQWQTAEEIGDPALVRSIQFVVDFKDGELFEPGEQIALQFRTHTQPYLEPQLDYPVAWNTVAVGGQALQGGTPVRVPATEGRRVGVAYPTGTMNVTKTVSGAGAAFAPKTFPGVQVMCEVPDRQNDGSTVMVPVPGIAPITLTPDESTGIGLVPAGAECIVAEPDHGQTSWSVEPEGPVKIQASGIPGTARVSVDNVYSLGGLTVAKRVADRSGIKRTDEFTFSAVCTFLDEPVLDEEFSLAPDATAAFESLPAGAECLITETDAGTADDTTVTVDGGPPVPGPSATVVVPVGAATGFVVTTTNVYDVNDLVVKKVVTGTGGTPPSGVNRTFDVQVVCRLDSADTNPIYSGTTTLTAGGQLTITDLPHGTECVVTETDDGGATESTTDPRDGTVTIGDKTAKASVVTVTNDFRTGALRVLKEVNGPGVPTLSDGPFDFGVVCTYEGATVIDEQIRLTGDGTGEPLVSDPIPGIPVGADCFATEMNDGGADAPPPPIRVKIPDETDNGPVTVTAGFVNVFSGGTAAIEKVIDGPAAEESWATEAEFTVLATCQLDVDGTRVTLHSAEYTLRAGETVSLVDADGNVSVFPLGTHCFIEETETGGATETAVSAGSYDDAAIIEIDDELQLLTLTATNTFEYGGFEVTKTLSGSGADDARPLSFDMRAMCVLEQAEPLTVLDETFAIRVGETVSYTDLPRGAECTITETNAQGADATAVTVDGETIAEAVFVLVDDTPVAVAFDNTFIDDLPVTGASGLPLWAGGTGLLMAMLGGLLVYVRWRERRV
ncbi:MAG: DUF5979 domain-containing protein [Microbacterium sp.]|uniref:DUF5979 domain-containing protein n=1 Tax=Microbacterium sp. TaxID=51671 RepID=UPI003A885542